MVDKKYDFIPALNFQRERQKKSDKIAVGKLLLLINNINYSVMHTNFVSLP